MSNKLIQGTLIFTFAAVLTAGLNFLFYTLGRFIGPEDFGVLVSLLSLSFVISIAQTVVFNVVTKVVATHKLSSKQVEQHLLKILLIAQILLAISFILLGTIFLRSYLNISDITPFAMLALLALSSLFLAMYRGILRGSMSFADTAITQIIESVLKLIFAVTAIALGLGINGILFGLAVGSLITLIVAKLLSTRLTVSEKEVDVLEVFSIKSVTAVSIGFIVINLMFIVDGVMARSSLAAYDAGIYGAVITFGKLVFFLAGSISIALFPISASGNGSLKDLKQSLIISSGIGLFATIAFAFLGTFLVQSVFGLEFIEAASYLAMQTVIMTIFVLANNIVLYLISRDYNKINPFLFLSLLMQIGLIHYFGNSIAAVLNIQMVVMSFQFLISVYFLLTFRREQKADQYTK